MVKRRKSSPIKHIVNTPNPDLESMHIKAPGHNITDVSLFRTNTGVDGDEDKIKEYLEKTGATSYFRIHTHPSLSEKGLAGPYEYPAGVGTNKKYSFPGKLETRPSIQDIYSFLSDNRQKSEFIAQQNSDGTVTGIILLQKQMNPHENALKKREEFIKDMTERVYWEYETGDTIDTVAKTFGFNYKFIPVAKDHPANVAAMKRSIEQKVYSVTTILGILGSIFFLLPNMTGNAIANINFQNSSILGTTFLIIALVSAFFWIKNKKIRKF